MAFTEILPGIHYVGVNDRTTTRFESLWSLPYGVSYNSYLVIDEKVALIDTVEVSFGEQFIDNIRAILKDRPIDYLVVDHMEPDHSSSIKTLRLLYPEMQIVGNAKTLQMLDGYYGIHTLTREVKEGESISLGQKPLVLYGADGSLARSDGHLLPRTQGTLLGGCVRHVRCPERRYPGQPAFAGPFLGRDAPLLRLHRGQIRRPRTESPPKTERPSHRNDLLDARPRMAAGNRARNRYLRSVESLRRRTGCGDRLWFDVWQYGPDGRENRSGAGRTGCKNIIVYNLSYADISNVIRDIFKYDTLIVGSPTYNGELFPEVGSLLQKISERCIPCRKFAYFGSYTWAGAAVRLLGEFAQKMKWEAICQPTEMKQGYDDQGHNAARHLPKPLPKNPVENPDSSAINRDGAVIGTVPV